MHSGNCPFDHIGCEQMEAACTMVAGKWKLRILYSIATGDIMRYSELKRALQPITHKMLSAQLKELERDGLIHRKEYPQVPPKVEYSLTEKGYGLIPMFREMCSWILKYESN